MTNLFEILDGYIEQTGDMLNDRDVVEAALHNVKEIDQYASNGCGRHLTDDQVKRTSTIGLRWVAKVNQGNGEWSSMRHEAMDALDG